MEWGRGPWSWRAVLAFLPRGPRVPSYATELAGGSGVWTPELPKVPCDDVKRTNSLRNFV